jgi:hypothetical protein
MQYLSGDDLRRAYNGTIVSYKDVVYAAMTEGLSILLNSLKDGKKVTIDATKEFTFDSIDLGYSPLLEVSNFHYALVYYGRRPIRQWQQGLSERTLTGFYHTVNTEYKSVYKTNCRVNIYDNAPQAMLLKTYQPFNVVVDKGGGGLNKDYGLTQDKFVLFNGVLIGSYTKKGIGLLDKYYYNSIIREDLEDRLNVPNVWKQELDEKEI